VTDPLRIRRPERVPALREAAAVAVVAIPVGAFLFLLLTGRPLHLPGRATNLLAHALLLLVPLVWAAPLLPRRLELVGEPGELLVASTHLRELGTSWWQSVLVWPAPLLGVVVLAEAAAGGLLGPNEALATPAWDALLTFLLVFALAVFYANGFLQRHEVRLVPEGLRVGLPHFVPWESIERMAPRPDGWALHHRVNPCAPFVVIRFRDDEARERLAREIERRDVLVKEGSCASFHLARAGLALAALILLASGGLAWRSGLHGGLVVLAVFLAGIAGTLAVERLRGLAGVQTLKPVVEGKEESP